MAKIRTINDLRKEISTNQELMQKLIEKPEETLLEIQNETPLETDKWIYRIVVLSLSFIIIFVIVAVFVLYSKNGDNKIPDIFLTISSAALGALTGLLIPSPTQNSN